MFVGCAPAILRPLGGLVSTLTWNSADKTSGATLSADNLTVTGSTTGQGVRATISATGVVAVEFIIGQVGATSNAVGLAAAGFAFSGGLGNTGSGATASIGYRASGAIRIQASTLATIATYTSGDKIQMQYDLPNTQLTIYKNSVQIHTRTYQTSGSLLFPAFTSSAAGSFSITINGNPDGLPPWI